MARTHTRGSCNDANRGAGMGRGRSGPSSGHRRQRQREFLGLEVARVVMWAPLCAKSDGERGGVGSLASCGDVQPDTGDSR